MNFVEKITGIINNPKETMKNIAEEPHIEEAVMIVGIIAVFSAVQVYLLIDQIIPVSESMPASMHSIFAVLFIVFGLIGTFIGWLIGTGIIHLLSMAFGGEGKFHPQLITVAGYSMIPRLFGIIITLALIPFIEPSAITKVALTPFSLALNVFNIIMEIWAAAIFIFGVQSVHKLDFKKSAIVVGIPLAIIIIFEVVGIWMSSTL